MNNFSKCIESIQYLYLYQLWSLLCVFRIDYLIPAWLIICTMLFFGSDPYKIVPYRITFHNLFSTSRLGYLSQYNMNAIGCFFYFIYNNVIKLYLHCVRKGKKTNQIVWPHLIGGPDPCTHSPWWCHWSWVISMDCTYMFCSTFQLNGQCFVLAYCIYHVIFMHI